MNSLPNKTYRIEFFGNTVCDDSDHGEGDRFLGAMDLSTDAGGDGTINFSVPANGVVAGGEFVTATATDPDGKTSEFGPCLFVSRTGSSNDLDGDGISNAYELEHFGSKAGGDSNAELDGDGHTNLFEFLTLKDPNNAESAFEASPANAGNSPAITIQTEIGRIYRLHESSDMVTFLPLGNPTVGYGGLVELVQPNPGVRRFYQITVGLP